MNKLRTKKSKHWIITGVIVIGVVLILVFIPKPIYIEFVEPKQPNELTQMFQNIPMTNIEVDAIGENYSGGGFVENLGEVDTILNDFELQNGEVIGIISIEFTTTGTDLIYLITHKKDYDIKNIYVLSIIMGRIEDQIERMIY